MRLVTRFVRVLALVLAAVIGLSAAVAISTQTAWFRNWLRGYVVREASKYLNGQLSIGRLEGDLFNGVTLEDVELSVDGQPVVAMKALGVDYSAFTLLSKGISLDHLRINEPVVHLRRSGGRWSLARVVKAERAEANRSGPSRPITIGDVEVTNGSISIDDRIGPDALNVPRRIEQLDARLAFSYEPVRYSIEISRLSLRASDPAMDLTSLSGKIAVRNDTLYVSKIAARTSESSIDVDGTVAQYLSKPIFNLDITSDRMVLPEIARVVPALAGVPLQPAFHVVLDGPLDRLGIAIGVQSSVGDVTGRLTADLITPDQSIAGDVDVRHLNLRPILTNRTDTTDITAHISGGVRGRLARLGTLEGSLKTSAPHVAAVGYAADNIDGVVRLKGRTLVIDVRARAYGAQVTSAGRLILPEDPKPFEYDLHGLTRGLDLRKLPPRLKLTAADTDINTTYHLVGSGQRSVRVDAELLQSTVAGAGVAPPSTAWFTLEGDHVGYGGDATLSNIDLPHMGRAFNAPVLDADRYKSRLNGHVVMTGHGTTWLDVDIAANGMLVDSSIGGGRVPQLTFDGTFANDTLHVKGVGSFAGFDPARVSGRPAMAGQVDGDADVDVTVGDVSKGLTVQAVQEATGRVTLEPSTIGELAIERATIEGDYRDAAGEIRQFEVVGRDLNVRATGTLALNDTGQSNLAVHADTPSLGEVGKLVNQALAGIGMLDATITGNRRELQVAGTFVGDGVKYKGQDALVLSTRYTVTIPDLALADASGSATTDATFVTIGGQNINELTAKTGYKSQQLDFDITAKQPQRSVRAVGAASLNAERHEALVDRLSLQSGNVQWQTPVESDAVIRYADGALSVRDLRLANGNQAIAVDGTFGRPGDKMAVTLGDISLADVDALLLRPLLFSGTLNASAEIGGTRVAPTIAGMFSVVKGAFGQVQYQSFKGTVDAAGRGLTIDTRLEQTPENWIEAKGYVPRTAFGVLSGASPTRDHREPTAREDAFDLHVNSSAVALGLVGGFTSVLANVKGTAQVKVDITGAADDPHPNGSIAIQDASFTVTPTGAAYAHINGRIDLEADRIHIADIEILDAQQQALSITGDLAIHERQVGGVNININTRDFSIVKNKYGDLRVDSDLQITGELTRPSVEGDLGVSTGVINLDPVLESVNDAAFEARYPAEATASEKPQTLKPSGFKALRLNVHLTIPDDLVVKSSDLRTPDAPIGLGAMTLTLGGDLQATKEAGAEIVRVVGNVNTVRGTYNFQGRTFTILRDGTIRFEGTDDFNPDLNITAQRIIQGVEADVAVQGTLKEPQINLRSVPPLDQAEILSLIVFNQPSSQLGVGQQVALTQRAQELATGAFAGTLANSLGGALNLTELNIQTGTQVGAVAQITAGQQLGQNLYVKVEQGFGQANTTNFILEYELAKWLRLRTNLLQGSAAQPALFQRAQGSGIDLLFTFRH